MKLATSVLIGAAAVQAIKIQKASPGAIGGAAPGSEGSIGAASSAYGAATSGTSAASAGIMSALKGLISEITAANQISTSQGTGSAAGAGYAGSAAGSAAAGAGADGGYGGLAAGSYGGITGDEGTNAGANAAAEVAALANGQVPSGSAEQGSSTSKFVQGQMLHFGAANVMEHPEEVEVENAIRAGMATPSQVGPYPMPELSAELSREYPTSFLKIDPSSLMAGAKMSPADMDAVAASVAAETAQFATRASGCGACPAGVNYGSCPAGYTESRAGECTPSPAYKGLCSRPIDISSFSEVEKDEMELVCDTCFKCN